MAYQEPNKDGFYGKFGGRFVPETLMTAVLELEKAYRESQADPSFQEELTQLLRQYVGRETPLYYAKNLTQHIGGAKIYLKREDLNHTGVRSHPIGLSLYFSFYDVFSYTGYKIVLLLFHKRKVLFSLQPI